MGSTMNGWHRAEDSVQPPRLVAQQNTLTMESVGGSAHAQARNCAAWPLRLQGEEQETLRSMLFEDQYTRMCRHNLEFALTLAAHRG